MCFLSGDEKPVQGDVGSVLWINERTEGLKKVNFG
jgi:hypothetical protein